MKACWQELLVPTRVEGSVDKAPKPLKRRHYLVPSAFHNLLVCSCYNSVMQKAAHASGFERTVEISLVAMRLMSGLSAKIAQIPGLDENPGS